MRKKVLIVDDSAVARLAISAVLSGNDEFEIAVAADPHFATTKMAREWPDVIVLDIETPGMDGINFLKKIMAERPTPVVVSSTLASRGAPLALQALAAGAVDVIEKPQSDIQAYFEAHGDHLSQVISHAAAMRVHMGAAKHTALPAAGAKTESKTSVNPHSGIVAIGASTGGTHALEAVLTALPKHSPPIMVVQHMPEKYTAAFAQRLNSLCAIEVKEAKDGDPVVAGQALIAPGGFHLSLARRGVGLVAEVTAGPRVNRHRPSVDILFHSVAKLAGRGALGIILTGMGDDGARGLKEMRERGAYTIAQDEASCVVYGMPKEAVKIGAVAYSAPLGDIPSAIMSPRWMNSGT